MNHRLGFVSVMVALVMGVAAIAAVTLLGIGQGAPGNHRPPDIVTLPGAAVPGRFSAIASDQPIGQSDVKEPEPKLAPIPIPSDVAFARGSAALLDPAAVDASLAPLVFAAGADPSLMMQLDAHASADASEETNLRLSLARGIAIGSRFVAAGIAPERLVIIAHGEANLPVPERPESGENRVVRVTAVRQGARP